MTVPVPTIAILIACHNRRDTTLACLAALARQTVDAALHLFLFDDGSTDGTSASVRRVAPAATIIQGDGTAFWAGAMRHLFDRALSHGFDHYLWLNDDVVLDDDAVARLLAVVQSFAGRTPVLVGGAVQDPRSGRFTYGGIDRRVGLGQDLRFKAVPPSAHEPRICHTLHGNVVLVPAATAKRIGSIGSAYVHTLGDLDYGLRVTAHGGTVVLAPGFCGTCSRNPGASRWFQPALSLRQRWQLLRHPRGFPIRPWIAFARCHGGPLWPLLAAVPFWRLFVPTAMMLSLQSVRRPRARAA